jgi:hypothetical protein
MQATIYFLLKQVVNPTLTQHSPSPCICDTFAPHYCAMDNNLLSLMITNQHSVDHFTQLESEERGRFSLSRRNIERHDLELQARITESTFSI